MGTTVEDQVNVVLYDSPQVPSPKYAKQDLAWATVTQEQGSSQTIDVGPVNGIRDPKEDELVQFSGATSEELYTGWYISHDEGCIPNGRWQH